VPPTGDPLGHGVLDLVLNAGPVGQAVLLILVIMSVITWGLIVEKWWQFRRIARQTAGFMRVFRDARRAGAVYAATKKYRDSPVAQLYGSALGELGAVPDVVDPSLDDLDDIGPERLESVHRACRRAATVEIARLERYLPFLATTASAAPFIGLFGTVWGVMAAFHAIGREGSASLAVVAPGISEALIATAAGLGAAIPAVIGYNYYVNRVKQWANEMDNFILDLLNFLGRPLAKVVRPAKDGL
jgi:biopolymer transport protein TolQ